MADQNYLNQLFGPMGDWMTKDLMGGLMPQQPVYKAVPGQETFHPEVLGANGAPNFGAIANSYETPINNATVAPAPSSPSPLVNAAAQGAGLLGNQLMNPKEAPAFTPVSMPMGNQFAAGPSRLAPYMAGMLNRRG